MSNEGEMAKSQLRTVMSAAEDLMNLLDDEDTSSRVGPQVKSLKQ